MIYIYIHMIIILILILVLIVIMKIDEDCWILTRLFHYQSSSFIPFYSFPFVSQSSSTSSRLVTKLLGAASLLSQRSDALLVSGLGCSLESFWEKQLRTAAK